MEDSNTQSSKALGTAGFVIAIFSLIFSLIPCVGYYALIPSILAIVFSIVGHVNLKKAQKNVGLFITGWIVGVFALVISGFQYYTFHEVFEVGEEINRAINDASYEIEEEEVIEDVLQVLEHELGKEIDRIEKADSLKDAMQ